MINIEKNHKIVIRRKLLPENEFHYPTTSVVKCSEHQIKYISQFNENVRHGLIEYESVPCLCGSTTFDLIGSVDRYAMLQDTVMCVECSLVQSNPRMTKDEYAHFYSSDIYRLCYEGEGYLNFCENKYTIEQGKRIFYEVNKLKNINSDIDVLEIGAGGGWNLLPFLKNGAKVLGIDYSPTLTQLGIKYGIPMKQCSVNDISGQFDIVIMNHTLEHLMNPVESLKIIARHLKDDGLIYIAVPSIRNFTMGQLQNAHTYYFDPYTLERYCTEAGLKLLKMGKAQKIHIFGIFRSCVEGEKSGLINQRVEINFVSARIKIYLKRLLKC